MSQTLTVKTLKQEKFTVEIEPTSTIGAAKEIIAEKRGLQLAGMKLIHSGRILKDTVTVAECNLKETDFLVLMGKPKPPGEAKAATPAPATTSTPTPQATPAATTPAAETPAAADSMDASADNSAPSAGSAEDIAALEAMGFPSDQVAAALRAAFGNRTRAAEYLMDPSSMPASAPPQTSSTPAPTASPSQPASSTPAPAAGGGGGPQALSPTSKLAPYLANEQFTHMRRQVQERPELLPALLVEIGRSNPAMVQEFNENREDFYLLLNSPIQGGGGGGGGGGGHAGHAGQGQVQVSPEENAAIERLCALGFDKNDVIQVYFACDKNEQLAANMLTENFRDF